MMYFIILGTGQGVRVVQYCAVIHALLYFITQFELRGLKIAMGLLKCHFLHLCWTRMKPPLCEIYTVKPI